MLLKYFSGSKYYWCLTANEIPLLSSPKEYFGILQYRKEDEAKIVQNLILGTSVTLCISAKYNHEQHQIVVEVAKYCWIMVSINVFSLFLFHTCHLQLCS